MQNRQRVSRREKRNKVSTQVDYKKKKWMPNELCVLVMIIIAVAGFGVWIMNSYSETLDMGEKTSSKRKPLDSYGGMKLGLPLDVEHTHRQKAVVRAFKHAWKAYRINAWGKDELNPISGDSSEWFNLGLTLIDALDTMWLMGLKDEFNEAREWVRSEMQIAQDKDVNLFETTIRVLGGLLSTYHLTGDALFLERAKELGDRLLPCFDTRSNIPFSDVNLYTGQVHAPKWGPDSSVSEVSTIQLEFRDLTMLTKDKKYKQAVDKVMNKLQLLPKKDHLVPLFINAETGQLRPGTLTMGARADTYYEYLLKQWIQSGKKEKKFMKWFLQAMKGVEQHLVHKSKPSHLTFIGEELQSGAFYPKMDHLVCYLPGTLLLGIRNGLPKRLLPLATNLMYTCYKMYESMPTGLSPEIVHFDIADQASEDIIVKPLDRHNLLRPETIESLFYFYRDTKNETYRTWGWKIFEAFEKYTKVKGGGYSSINNVLDPKNPEFRDKMETFFLGETLKYFFLLFSDNFDVINIDSWIINTEAHPLPVWSGYY